MRKYAASILLVTCLVAGCSVRAPEVQVTGEKTALENQVIGTYQQVADESWMIASTRAADSGQKAQMATEKKEVLEAVQNRKFNKDDIDEFKREGALGENNQGFLELRPLPRLEEDAEYRSLVLRIMNEENRDRKIIYDRVLELNPNASRAGASAVYAVFAKMNIEESAPGTWVQDEDGTWRRKGKESGPGTKK
ncbi:MAG: YdbL family protein [candidate division KSB1 bacterium]|nr:YdbL family protein [candidate division KSB1 bacterium]MDZ7391549.1 YdbL family protein [candidate division KSB1 bacterium]MDZ7412293.1 YdbL family protein [candidate division KSB1 bacterium]